jgi:hypothetical protein
MILITRMPHKNLIKKHRAAIQIKCLLFVLGALKNGRCPVSTEPAHIGQV